MTTSPASSKEIETLADLEALALRVAGQVVRGEISDEAAVERAWDIARRSELAKQVGDDVLRAQLGAVFMRAGRELNIQNALDSDDGLIVTRMADIEMRAIEWLWPDRVAIGKVTEFAGPGGIGKSTLMFDVAARVSRGGGWPDNPIHGVAQSVFILSAEDDPADTIKPRLAVAGADMDKVFFLSMIRTENGGAREFNLQADIAELERRIGQIGDVGLVAIDPLTAYFGKANVNSDTAVRKVLKPLGDMAARTRVGILGSNHFSKAEGRSVMRRMLGAAAFVNAPRIVFVVTPDPDDPERRLLLPAKANLTGKKSGLSFLIREAAVGDQQRVPATRIEWDSAPMMMTADAALAALKQNAGGNSAKAQAIAFLRDALAEGPKPAKDVAALATDARHSRKTVQRAREALQIRSSKTGTNGEWIWALPDIG